MIQASGSMGSVTVVGREPERAPMPPIRVEQAIYLGSQAVAI